MNPTFCPKTNHQEMQLRNAVFSSNPSSIIFWLPSSLSPHLHPFLASSSDNNPALSINPGANWSPTDSRQIHLSIYLEFKDLGRTDALSFWRGVTRADHFSAPAAILMASATEGSLPSASWPNKESPRSPDGSLDHMDEGKQRFWEWWQ